MKLNDIAEWHKARSDDLNKIGDRANTNNWRMSCYRRARHHNLIAAYLRGVAIEFEKLQSACEVFNLEMFNAKQTEDRTTTEVSEDMVGET